MVTVEEIKQIGAYLLALHSVLVCNGLTTDDQIRDLKARWLAELDRLQAAKEEELAAEGARGILDWARK